MIRGIARRPGPNTKDGTQRRRSFTCLQMCGIAAFVVLLPLIFNVTKTLQSITPSITSIGDPGDFVTRSHSQLFLHGHSFRFAGANMFWLGLNDSGEYPSQFRIYDGLDTAQEMGATVLRVLTLGISTGCHHCIEPTRGVFNDTAFLHNDYAIKAANDRGMRLVIPFTDNWRYAFGGKHNFTAWRGISDENQFYTNPTVIADFEIYIKTLLNHVNIYTGLAYKDDPTIMAWETGNELKPTTSWTQTISTYIKNIASRQLVLDGRSGIDLAATSLTHIDIVSMHYYPKDAAQIQIDAARARRADKAFYIGEFDWNDANGGDSLSSFLATIESNSTIAGDAFWNLWSHNDTYGYFSSEAKFALYYPGDSATMSRSVQLLRTHAYKMRGQPVPRDSRPGIPVINSITKERQKNVLIWRGTAVAAHYTVERSLSGPGGPWTVICDKCATDVDTPWTDQKTPKVKAWYRVTAYNLSGGAGEPSVPYQVAALSTKVYLLFQRSFESRGQKNSIRGVYM